MLDTNLLLSIGFSMISNFAQVVHIPAEMIPRSRTDLQRCDIGAPFSPTYLYLVDTSGTRIRIMDGVVRSFASSSSYFEHPELAYKRTGVSTMSSNDVI